jgi:hypothetical protein
MRISSLWFLPLVLFTASPSLPASRTLVVMYNCLFLVLGSKAAFTTTSVLPYKYELLYVAPAALCATTMSPALTFLTIIRGDARHGLLWYHFSLIMLLLAGPLDRVFCHVLGCMSYGAVHQFFLFCGVGMGAVMQSVVSCTPPLGAGAATVRGLERAAKVVAPRKGNQRAAAKKKNR